jgi:Uma2 family endonuclease
MIATFLSVVGLVTLLVIAACMLIELLSPRGDDWQMQKIRDYEKKRRDIDGWFDREDR